MKHLVEEAFEFHWKVNFKFPQRHTKYAHIFRAGSQNISASSRIFQDPPATFTIPQSNSTNTKYYFWIPAFVYISFPLIIYSHTHSEVDPNDASKKILISLFRLSHSQDPSMVHFLVPFLRLRSFTSSSSGSFQYKITFLWSMPQKRFQSVFLD